MGRMEGFIFLGGGSKMIEAERFGLFFCGGRVVSPSNICTLNICHSLEIQPPLRVVSWNLNTMLRR